MRNLAALLAVVVSICLAGSQTTASARVPTSLDPKRASESVIQTRLLKGSPTVVSAPRNPAHTFHVNDEKGVLLTCIAPEIENNADTDTFNDCTLAPGRTLDDVMHTFIGAIHYEQNQHVKERAEWSKDLEEKSAQKPTQK